jgi:hypothetical protein
MSTVTSVVAQAPVPLPLPLSSHALGHQAGPPNESVAGSCISNDDFEEGPYLGTLYFQCRAAKNASRPETIVSLSQDESFSAVCQSQLERIGSFDCQEAKGVIEKIFHGSHFRQGPCEVNQSISATFDLSILMCVTCKKPHSIVGNGPANVFLSDQNFVECLESKMENSCLNMMRLEDASLEDLMDMVLKVFEGHMLPEGSVLLFVFASFLHIVGVKAFAIAWTALVEKLNNKWINFRVCPLTPVTRGDCPGSLARELQELASLL